MTTITTPTERRRITCDVVGRPKLLATVTNEGISVWCKICHAVHLIPRAIVMAAWERGESIQCEKQSD